MLRYLFLIFLLIVSCNKVDHSEKKQVLRVNLGMEPQTLDPRRARDLQTITLLHMLYEGLTRPSGDGKAELALAQEFETSADGLQVRFRLRKALWSNGEPVSSFDFAESWKSILDPSFPTDIAYQLYVIKNARRAKLGEVGIDQVGIHTPDPNTLVIELEQPVPYLLELLSMASFLPVPSKLARDSNWANSPEMCMCNGPFVIQSWAHSDQVEVVKNPHYWQASDISLDSIEFLIMENDTEMKMFEEGKLDWAGSPLSTIPADAIPDLRRKKSLHISPFAATYFYRVNTTDEIRGKKNPLSSSSFRKALSFALNRNLITEHILQGGHTPARGLIPPEMGLSESGYFQDDLRERTLLKRAQEELGIEEIPPITISYTNSERNAVIAQAIQKQWEENLGIKVELEAIEPKTFFQRISQKEYQLAAGSWTADFNDPINFLEVFKYKDGSTNNTNWEDSKYIDLLNRSALCKSGEEREGILREAEQILMEQMPIIPVFHFVLNYLQREDLEDVALSPLGRIDFRHAHFVR